MSRDKNKMENRMGVDDYFEKNRYFDGKLITAQDLEIEQQYHTERLNVINRSVIGGGIVSGLNARINETDTRLEVIVQPGIALDKHGRPILVLEEESLEKDEPSSEEDEIYLYLGQDRQPWETVPNPASTGSSTDRCEYNRIIEHPEFELTTQKKSGILTKTVPEIDLSTRDREGIAKQYYSHTINGRTTTEREGAPKKEFVLVGSFRRSSEQAWSEAKFTPGPLVYHNDMLYAILANHVLDFDNPHRVGNIQSGNGKDLKSVLESSDGSIDIDPGRKTDKIDLRVAEAIQDALRSLHHHHRKKALNTLRWSFDDLATKFDSTRKNNSIAEYIRKNITNSLEEPHMVFQEEKHFLDFSEDYLLDGEMLAADIDEKYGLVQLEEDLEDRATEASLESYSTALKKLREALDVRGTDRDIEREEDEEKDRRDLNQEARDLEVINAYYYLNEAVKRLERHITTPQDLPIDVIPGITQSYVDELGSEINIKTVSDLSDARSSEIEGVLGVSEELASLWITSAEELHAE